MGVVHKLKQDVIDFIIDQKKQLPNLSCRKLVNIVYHKLQIKLSKSSINAILLQENLSSPVGRRPIKGKVERNAQKKFKIPDEKRQQIFITDAEEKSLKSEKRKIEQQKEKVSKTPPQSPQGPKNERSEKQGFKPPRMDIDGSKKENFAEADNSRKGVFCDGLGAIFYKAAEWEIFGKGILGKYLKEFAINLQSRENEKAGEVLSLMTAFGIKSVDELSLYRGNGLWQLCALENPIPAAKWGEMIGSMKNFEKIGLRLSIDLAQALRKVRFYRITLENQNQIHVDANMISIWKKNVQLEGFGSIYQTTSNIAKKFLSNVQFAVIHSAISNDGVLNQENKGHIFNEFIALVESFNNVPGKRMQRIEILGDCGEELGFFDEISDQKRILISAVWPWQPMFEEILKKIVWGQETTVYISSVKKEMSYWELPLSMPESAVSSKKVLIRGILVKNPQSPMPIVLILTNCEQAKASAQNIIESYFSKWPNYQKKVDINSVNTPLFKIGNVDEEKAMEIKGGDKNDVNDRISLYYDIYDLISAVFEEVNRWVMERYLTTPFDKSDPLAVTGLYEIKGRLARTRSEIHAFLDLSQEDSLLKNKLERAAMRVNEAGIADPENKILKITII